MNNFSKKSLVQVGELWLALVLSEFRIPIYSEFEKIVEDLFELEDSESAKYIVKECFRIDYLGLREIVHKYN